MKFGDAVRDPGVTYFGFHVSSVTVSHVKCITDAVKVYLAGH